VTIRGVATTRIELVLFDAVGTLLELQEPVGETYARLAAEHGVRLPGWRLDDAFQRVLRRAPPMVFPGESAEGTREGERAWWYARVRETFKAADQTAHFEDFDAFFALLFAHYGGADAWRATVGAAAALARLSAEGRRLAVASNFDHRLASVLQALDLASFFELVWGPAQAGAAKPERAFFAGLLSRLGVPAQAALHVGDDPEEDGAAARRAGLHAVVLRPPATLHDLPEQIGRLEDGGR
jgi:putative hydrolase of the HAD superfamily